MFTSQLGWNNHKKCSKSRTVETRMTKKSLAAYLSTRSLSCMVLHCFRKTDVTINWHRWCKYIFDAKIVQNILRHAEMFPTVFPLTCRLYLELLNHRLLVSSDVPWESLRLSRIIKSGCVYFTNLFYEYCSYCWFSSEISSWKELRYKRSLHCLADASSHHIKSMPITSYNIYNYA